MKEGRVDVGSTVASYQAEPKGDLLKTSQLWCKSGSDGDNSVDKATSLRQLTGEDWSGCTVT